jgi:hypothetical protein
MPGLEDGDYKEVWNVGSTAHIYLVASPQKGIRIVHKLFYFWVSHILMAYTDVTELG